jgi:hypothetical protein
MFGENIKLFNGSVFLETQFCIGFVNISPIVPGRKYIFNTLVYPIFQIFILRSHFLFYFTQ